MYTANIAETVMFRNLAKELVNVSWRSQLNRGLLDIVAPLSKYVGDLV